MMNVGVSNQEVRIYLFYYSYIYACVKKENSIIDILL